MEWYPLELISPVFTNSPGVDQFATSLKSLALLDFFVLSFPAFIALGEMSEVAASLGCLSHLLNDYFCSKQKSGEI